MMPFLVTQSSSGVKRADKPSHYESVGEDPRFTYRFWLRRPRHMVVLLQALDQPLDPKLYADRGNGFDEATAISLQHAGTCFYCITVTSPYRVARIRFDPCSSEERFRYWAKFPRSEKELAEVLAEAKHEAGCTASVYDVVVDGNPEKRRRRALEKSAAGHFAAVVALAHRAAARPQPASKRPADFVCGAGL
jgi:hypothetical protein